MKNGTLATAALLLLALGCGTKTYQTPDTPPSADACEVEQDDVIAEHAVGPRWLEWENSCLPNADIVYVDHEHWNLWAMDEHGGHRQCLTCSGDNVVGSDFPLDDDGAAPEIHWKGTPEPLRDRPIVLFAAENEHSAHKLRRNTPSIGWDNDLWALNVCDGTYTRLTELNEGEGLQHAAMSHDDRWLVYPLRYDTGNGLKNFGKARMVFSRILFDDGGRPRLDKRRTAEPLGGLYYEPNDIRADGEGRYSLFYVAGDATMLDPYRYDWCEGPCEPTNTQLLETSDLHEEFTMVSPSSQRLAWMRGPQSGLGYRADLFLSALDFEDAVRVTYYNDCERWPERCLSHGGQLSALSWSKDGRKLSYGLWKHGKILPFDDVEIHRLQFAGRCGGMAEPEP